MSESSSQDTAKDPFRYEQGDLIVYDRFPRPNRLLYAGINFIGSFVHVVRISGGNHYSWILLGISTLITIAILNYRLRLVLDPKAKRIVKESGVRPFSKITEIPCSELESLEIDANESKSPSGEISLLLQIRIGWSSTNWFTPSILEGTSLEMMLAAARRDAELLRVPVILSDKVTQMLSTSGSGQGILARKT